MGDLDNAWNTVKKGYEDVKNSDAGQAFRDVTGITAGQALYDQYTGKSAAEAEKEALAQQEAAASQATQLNRDIYNQNREDLTLRRFLGDKALAGLDSNRFMDDWQQDPGYQFRMDEGLKAINAGASARGGLHSGATMKALTRFGQDYASQEYGNVYNRENNRLSKLAGFGESATNQGINSANQYGQNQSNLMVGMGNARANSAIGQQAAYGQGINNAVNLGIGLASSDKRLKKNIKLIAKEDLQEMKMKLKAYFFDYKSKEHGQGTWAGVMAQDLEKSKLGKTLVVENEQGHKMVDMKKVMSLFLATIAEG